MDVDAQSEVREDLVVKHLTLSITSRNRGKIVSRYQARSGAAVLSPAA